MCSKSTSALPKVLIFLLGELSLTLPPSIHLQEGILFQFSEVAKLNNPSKPNWRHLRSKWVSVHFHWHLQTFLFFTCHSINLPFPLCLSFNLSSCVTLSGWVLLQQTLLSVIRCVSLHYFTYMQCREAPASMSILWVILYWMSFWTADTQTWTHPPKKILIYVFTQKSPCTLANVFTLTSHNKLAHAKRTHTHAWMSKKTHAESRQVAASSKADEFCMNLDRFPDGASVVHVHRQIRNKGIPWAAPALTGSSFKQTLSHFPLTLPGINLTKVKSVFF